MKQWLDLSVTLSAPLAKRRKSGSMITKSNMNLEILRPTPDKINYSKNEARGPENTLGHFDSKALGG